MAQFDNTADLLRGLLARGERLPLIDELAKKISDETVARIMSLEPEDDVAGLKADLEDETSDDATRMVLLAVAYAVAAWSPDGQYERESVDAHRAVWAAIEKRGSSAVTWG